MVCARARCCMRAFQARVPSGEVVVQSQRGHWTERGGSSPRKCERQCVSQSEKREKMAVQFRNQNVHS